MCVENLYGKHKKSAQDQLKNSSLTRTAALSLAQSTRFIKPQLQARGQDSFLLAF